MTSLLSIARNNAKSINIQEFRVYFCAMRTANDDINRWPHSDWETESICGEKICLPRIGVGLYGTALACCHQQVAISFKARFSPKAITLLRNDNNPHTHSNRERQRIVQMTQNWVKMSMRIIPHTRNASGVITTTWREANGCGYRT